MMSYHEFKTKVQSTKEDKIKSSSFVYRIERGISGYLTWLISTIGPSIKPSHITLIGISSILLAIILTAASPSVSPLVVVIVQLLLLRVGSLLDKVDGELARAQSYFTQRGIFYDIIFHFLYTAAFYYSVGYYFYVITGGDHFLMLAVLMTILATCHKLAGKFRHHVRFKIILEGHQNDIKDAGRNRSLHSSGFFVKLVHYSIFMIYDWAWMWYALLVVVSVADPLIAAFIYMIHTLVGIVVVAYELLVEYPRRSLYQREELGVTEPPMDHSEG